LKGDIATPTKAVDTDASSVPRFANIAGYVQILGETDIRECASPTAQCLDQRCSRVGLGGIAVFEVRIVGSWIKLLFGINPAKFRRIGFVPSSAPWRLFALAKQRYPDAENTLRVERARFTNGLTPVIANPGNGRLRTR
jgi:hypothetical protein